nr:MAG: capsid protein [Cressdnaviricota sp.]
MRKLPRKVFKILRKNGKFRGVRRTRRRRFSRARRGRKTELKWILTNASQNISAGTLNTTVLTPVNLAQGVAVNQRIGDQCKFIKVDVRMEVINNSPTTLPAAAPQYQSGLTRVIVWSPRIEFARANNYVTLTPITLTTLLDFNVMNVFADFMVTLSPPYMQSTTTNGIGAAPFAYYKLIRKSISFPRKVKFSSYAPDITEIDNEKDSLYLTFVNDILDIRMAWQAKTWFVDA